MHKRGGALNDFGVTSWAMLDESDHRYWWHGGYNLKLKIKAEGQKEIFQKNEIFQNLKASPWHSCRREEEDVGKADFIGKFRTGDRRKNSLSCEDNLLGLSCSYSSFCFTVRMGTLIFGLKSLDRKET